MGGGRSLSDEWKSFLLNQFHDVLPGTCIKEVVEDAMDIYKHLVDALTVDNGNGLKMIGECSFFLLLISQSLLQRYHCSIFTFGADVAFRRFCLFCFVHAQRRSLQCIPPASFRIYYSHEHLWCYDVVC